MFCQGALRGALTGSKLGENMAQIQTTTVTTKTNTVPQDVSINAHEAKKAENMKTMKEMCERDRQKVKGIFRFYECPGGQLCFSFKAYKWDDVERYTLNDGEHYEIPLGVAKHLNKNGWYPEHHYLLDEAGIPKMRVGQKVRRFGFQSLEFIDPEEIGESKASELVTVTTITKH